MKFTRACICLVAAAVTASLAQQPAPLPHLGGVEEFALKHPQPPFPKKARAQHIHGAGIFSVEVDFDSGKVMDVTVFKSTGSKMLDDSAIATLRRWEFRPRTIYRANVPIAFAYSKS